MLFWIGGVGNVKVLLVTKSEVIVLLTMIVGSVLDVFDGTDEVVLREMGGMTGGEDAGEVVVADPSRGVDL